MTIQQFHYVISVIDSGSFSRAADACFVTQPTLSAQIAKLENELGISLIDRLAKPARPAPGAEEIIAQARKALTGFNLIPRMAEELNESISGVLRIAIIPTLSQYLLPHFLKDFLRDYPQLRVEISELPSDTILAGLKDLRFDCGILALPAGVEGLSETHLFYEKFLVYLPPERDNLNMILAGGLEPGTIELDSLNLEDMLLLTEGHCLRDQIVEICGTKRSESSRHIAFETGSLESIKTLVDQGLGYSLIPQLACEGMVPGQVQRLRDIQPQAPVREIGMIHHPGFTRPRLIGLLADAIRNGLPAAVSANPGFNRIPWR